MKVLSRAWFVIWTPLQAALSRPTPHSSGVFCSQPASYGNALRLTGNADSHLLTRLLCNLKNIKQTAVNTANRIVDACHSHFGVVLISDKTTVTNI